MSAFATANGVPITSARIHLPREGVWHGDVVVHDDSLLDTSIAVNINGAEFRGTAYRVSVLEGSGVAVFCAGAGGLGRAVNPQHYTGVPLSTPLQDILRAAGETLAESSDTAVTGQQLAHWTVLAGKCGRALSRLVDQAEAVWRLLPNGSLWVGKESWPAQSADCEVLLEDVMADRAVLYMETPELLPGVTFKGRRVSYVEHELRGDGSLRTYAWFEKETA